MKFSNLKKLGLFSTLLFSYASLQAEVGILNTHFFQDMDSVAINVEEEQVSPSLCPLEPTKLTLEQADYFKETLGKIDVKFEVNRDAPCAMAFGQRRGHLKLRKGWSLPDLQAGKYEVYVNGESKGEISVFLPDPY